MRLIGAPSLYISSSVHLVAKQAYVDDRHVCVDALAVLPRVRQRLRPPRVETLNRNRGVGEWTSRRGHARRKLPCRCVASVVCELPHAERLGSLGDQSQGTREHIPGVETNHRGVESIFAPRRAARVPRGCLARL
eukprot:2976685-Pyramimonas_sp.AAC.1